MQHFKVTRIETAFFLEDWDTPVNALLRVHSRPWTGPSCLCGTSEAPTGQERTFLHHLSLSCAEQMRLSFSGYQREGTSAAEKENGCESNGKGRERK